MFRQPKLPALKLNSRTAATCFAVLPILICWRGRGVVKSVYGFIIIITYSILVVIIKCILFYA
jgi:hypothetical protein